MLYVRPGSPGRGRCGEEPPAHGAELRIRIAWDTGSSWLRHLAADIRGASRRPYRLEVRLVESNFRNASRSTSTGY